MDRFSDRVREYASGRRGASVLLVLALALGAGAVAWTATPIGGDVSVAAVLDAFGHCYDQRDRNPCFKELAREFVENGNEDAVFAAFAANEQAPNVFESCHVFTHFMGQAAFKEYGSVGKAMGHGYHVCFAGFYHGVLEGYFMEHNLNASTPENTAALKEALPRVCAELRSDAAGRQYNECLHGLGHALMFATNGEVPQALALCDALDPGEAEWCYSGVFMENSTSTTNPDHPSKYLKADDPLYPCTILDDRYLNSCYTLQSMYFAKLANGDWAKNVGWCLEVPVGNQHACFNGLGQNLAGYFTDPIRIRDECMKAPDAHRGACIEGAVIGVSAKYTDPGGIVADLCEVFAGEHRRLCTEAATRIIPGT